MFYVDKENELDWATKGVAAEMAPNMLFLLFPTTTKAVKVFVVVFLTKESVNESC